MSELAAIQIPANRVACIVCNKRLIKRGKYHDLNICTTNGSVVLVCGKHTRAGDITVQAIQLYAKKFN